MSKSLVSDELWAIVAPLLPPEPPRPRGGRPRSIPDRAALTGILFVLKSGIGWELLPQELGCGSGMTCWRRLRDWQQAGVWDRLHHELLQRLADADKLDWSRASLDSASVSAKRGGKATGPNPTDRGKPGTKRHVVVDRGGVPFAITLSAANVHDSRMLEMTLDAILPIRKPRGGRGRPRRRPVKLHADKGYDYPRCRAACRKRGVIPRIARRSSSRVNGWESTAGWSSARWLGSIASAA